MMKSVLHAGSRRQCSSSSFRMSKVHVRRYNSLLFASSSAHPLGLSIQQQQQQQQHLVLPQKSSTPTTMTRRWFDSAIDLNDLSSSNNSNKRRRRRGEKKSKKSSWNPSYRFLDRARVRVAGGRGGKGSTSQDQNAHRRRNRLRPDGGHGGNGGSVILVAHDKEQALLASWSQKHHAAAENGSPGHGQNQTGRNGRNTILRVPCGVLVKRLLNDDEEWDETRKRVIKVKQPSQEDEANSHQEDTDGDVDVDASVNFEAGSDDQDYHELEDDDDYYMNSRRPERRSVVLADLDEPGSHVVVARGGRGGLGTQLYASEHGPLPDLQVVVDNATPLDGEVAFLELELKLIADVGLVGFPNAGKSSLLHAMSRASPEVAPYPFTTRHPLIGVLEYRDGLRIQAADIPGLIDGAAQGRGCGHDFLRHVERTKALLYMVDVAGTDFRNPVEDLRVLVHELESYGDGSLLEHRALVVANKVDLMEKERAKEIIGQLGELSDSLGIQRDHDVMGISAGVSGKGLGILSQAIRETVKRSEVDREKAFQTTQQFGLS